MSVCGIDFSTKAVDIVLLDEDTDAATWQSVLLGGHDAFERARDVHTAMRAMIATEFWDDVLAVGIEDPRGYGAGSLYRIQGAILACLPQPLLVHPLIPSSWRKTVGLPGNASKDMVQEYASLRLEDAGWSTFRQPATQDFFDAYCIALATRSLLEIGEAA